MKVSVIIPCYNEKQTISTIVQRVLDCPLKDKEIIVVDDGSNDGTTEILKKEIEKKVDKVIYVQKNSGKGNALNTGFKAASGEVAVVQDADLEYDPSDLPILLKPIENNQADVVFGSRFVGAGPHRVVYFWHMVGNRFLTLISNMFTNINLSDMETCYKMFRMEIIKSIRIEEHRFGFEPEITAKVAHTKCRIYEVGISYYGRTYEEGKKIGWKDGLRAVYCVLKYNLWRRT